MKEGGAVGTLAGAAWGCDPHHSSVAIVTVGAFMGEEVSGA